MGLFSKDKPSKEEIMRNGGGKGHAKEVIDHHKSRPYLEDDEPPNCAGCHQQMTWVGGAYICRNRKCRFS